VLVTLRFSLSEAAPPSDFPDIIIMNQLLVKKFRNSRSGI